MATEISPRPVNKRDILGRVVSNQSVGDNCLEHEDKENGMSTTDNERGQRRQPVWMYPTLALSKSLPPELTISVLEKRLKDEEKKQKHPTSMSDPESTYVQLLTLCNALAVQHMQQGNSEAALGLLKRAESMTEKKRKRMADRRLLFRSITFNNIGCYYRRIGKLKTSLKYLHRALKIDRQRFAQTAIPHHRPQGGHLDDVPSVNVAKTLINISVANFQLDNIKDALAYSMAGLDVLTDEKANLEKLARPLQQLRSYDPVNVDVANNDARAGLIHAPIAVSYYNIAVMQDRVYGQPEACESFTASLSILKLLDTKHPLRGQLEPVISQYLSTLKDSDNMEKKNKGNDFNVERKTRHSDGSVSNKIQYTNSTSSMRGAGVVAHSVAEEIITPIAPGAKKIRSHVPRRPSPPQAPKHVRRRCNSAGVSQLTASKQNGDSTQNISLKPSAPSLPKRHNGSGPRARAWTTSSESEMSASEHSASGATTDYDSEASDASVRRTYPMTGKETHAIQEVLSEEKKPRRKSAPAGRDTNVTSVIFGNVCNDEAACNEPSELDRECAALRIQGAFCRYMMKKSQEKTANDTKCAVLIQAAWRSHRSRRESRARKATSLAAARTLENALNQKQTSLQVSDSNASECADEMEVELRASQPNECVVTIPNVTPVQPSPDAPSKPLVPISLLGGDEDPSSTTGKYHASRLAASLPTGVVRYLRKKAASAKKKKSSAPNALPNWGRKILIRKVRRFALRDLHCKHRTLVRASVEDPTWVMEEIDAMKLVYANNQEGWYYENDMEGSDDLEALLDSDVLDRIDQQDPDVFEYLLQANVISRMLETLFCYSGPEEEGSQVLEHRRAVIEGVLDSLAEYVNPIIASSGELVDLVFYPLLIEPALTNNCAYYFYKVALVFFRSHTAEFLDHLEKSQLLPLLVSHLGSSSVHDLVTELLEYDEAVQLFEAQNLPAVLIQELHTTEDSSTVDNLFFVISTIISKNSDPCFRTLNEQFDDPALIRQLLQTAILNCRSSVVALDTVNAILGCERNMNVASRHGSEVEANTSQNDTNDPSPWHVPAAVKEVAEHVGAVVQMLDESPQPCGAIGEVHPVKRLGMIRLKVCEFVAALIESGHHPLCTLLMTSKCIPKMIDLFFAHPNSNMLHIAVQRIVLFSLSGPCVEMKSHIIEDCGMFPRMREALGDRSKCYSGIVTAICTAFDDAVINQPSVSMMVGDEYRLPEIKSKLDDIQKLEGTLLGGNDTTARLKRDAFEMLRDKLGSPTEEASGEDGEWVTVSMEKLKNAQVYNSLDGQNETDTYSYDMGNLSNSSDDSVNSEADQEVGSITGAEDGNVGSSQPPLPPTGEPSPWEGHDEADLQRNFLNALESFCDGAEEESAANAKLPSTSESLVCAPSTDNLGYDGVNTGAGTLDQSAESTDSDALPSAASLEETLNRAIARGQSTIQVMDSVDESKEVHATAPGDLAAAANSLPTISQRPSFEK